MHHASQTETRFLPINGTESLGGTAHEGGHVHGAGGRCCGGEQPQADARRGGEGGRAETARG